MVLPLTADRQTRQAVAEHRAAASRLSRGAAAPPASSRRAARLARAHHRLGHEIRCGRRQVTRHRAQPCTSLQDVHSAESMLTEALKALTSPLIIVMSPGLSYECSQTSPAIGTLVSANPRTVLEVFAMSAGVACVTVCGAGQGRHVSLSAPGLLTSMPLVAEGKMYMARRGVGQRLSEAG